ncbi:iron ABC transporter permease [Coprobacter tertius]|uniref:Iron ABC transporter permease n=1 Tax=Coprobacter tertius TaxID=2944915 RepID=A0ABT1MIT2_9BACT|nr:iron ABC transporter permease [Coprobacter tertius]MCP9612346.1 iron ABC transporter permease [Coprobacter tertius]
MKNRFAGRWKYLIPLIIIITILIISNLVIGSVHIPIRDIWAIITGGESEKSSWAFIILQSRLPQTITALFCGSALAVSGLLLQTVFNNPLAGPSILGINTGASLGVAIVMLLFGGSIGTSGSITLSGSLAVVFGAFIGAGLILSIILFFSTLVRSNIMLLIIGIMIGYIASSVISLINFYATAEGVYYYTLWGMGDFSGVSLPQLPFFCISITAGLILALLLIKPLNALLLGERYAENLGVPIRRTRWILLVCTGILTATATAFCGPVSFIGLAVPHMARLLLGTSNHNILLPMTLLTGGAVALLCNLICVLPGETGILPLNAITPILGAPVIIYVIINQKKIQYFH